MSKGLNEAISDNLPREYFVAKSETGGSLSDHETQDQIWAALMDQKDLDLTEVEIDFKGGLITLMGTVSSLAMKRQVENLASQCIGVKSVKNDLHVLEPLGPTKDSEKPDNLEADAIEFE